LSCSLSLCIITQPSTPPPPPAPCSIISLYCSTTILLTCSVPPLPLSIAPSTLLYPSPSLVALAPRSSKISCHTQVQVVRTTAKICRRRFASIIGLIMHHPIRLISVISAVSQLWSTALLAYTRWRQVGAAALLNNLIARTCLISCHSLLQSLPCYIQTQNTVSALLVSLFRSPSRSPSLMPATWLLSPSYRLTPFSSCHYDYSRPTTTHHASCSFGPTRTPIDTSLDFVPSSFGFSRSWFLARSHSSCFFPSLLYPPCLSVCDWAVDRRTI
jgi:hypothetical protein